MTDVRVELTPDEIEAVRRTAQRLGITPNDLIRRAIADETFLDDVIAEGGEVVIKKGDRYELVDF